MTVQTTLPEPFSWVVIPAGQVTLLSEPGWSKNYIPLGASCTFAVPAFEIAQYPITNAQYAIFMQAGGYYTARWWTAAGWAQCQQRTWAAPRYWESAAHNGADHPVVGVSWYEAVAFCRWLSAASGEAIMLPTEQQWQRAAQGNDRRIYPWGNADPIALRCNYARGMGGTTPVNHYPDGASPFGVLDMAGNVWEWCLTAYETGRVDLDGTAVRVLRGGSNQDSTYPLRVAFRYWFNPDLVSADFGFRIARQID